jgi:hypothetical protein
MNERFAHAMMVVALSLAALGANATTMECPRSIVERPNVSPSSPEWAIVATTGERAVEHVGVYISVASEYGAQVPDSTRTVNREELVSWRLPSANTGRYWIGCSYNGTTAKLFTPLKADTVICVAAYALLPTGKRLRLKNINCR